MQTEREQEIFNKLIEAFKIYGKDNIVYSTLCESLIKIDKDEKLVLHLEDSPMPQNGCIMGYFSPYYNKLAVVVYKEDYDRKFLGLLTDWSAINKESVKRIMKTFLHEVVHYVAYNNSFNYLKLWNAKQKMLLQMAFIQLVLNNKSLFLPDTLQSRQFKTVNDVLNDKKFIKAFDTYYAIVRQTDMIKMNDFESMYTRIVTTLYTKCDWGWARFFDNVFTVAIEIPRSNGILNVKSFAIYYSIRRAYMVLFDGIEKSKDFVSLFYQELFVPSEIACIEVSCSDVITNLQDLTVKTLKLVI